MASPTIAILGVGVMGEMLVAALLNQGTDLTDLAVSVRRPERAAELAAAYGVTAVTPAQAAAQADVVVLGVKPQDMDTVLTQIADVVRPGAIVVTLAAGLPTTFYEQRLPQARVVRTMPNTPGVVGEGMTAIAGGTSSDAAAVAEARRLLRSVGRVVEIAESDIDLVSAVSGSGPAYVFLLAECMRDAAVELGLDADLASSLVRQTIIGAAALLKQSGVEPEVLRARVTSKKGTTHEAVSVLEDRGARTAMTDAMRAAIARARELAAES